MQSFLVEKDKDVDTKVLMLFVAVSVVGGVVVSFGGGTAIVIAGDVLVLAGGVIAGICETENDIG